MALSVLAAEHQSPRCFTIEFNKRALRNTNLTSAASYSIAKISGSGPALTETTIEVPEGIGDPLHVYIILNVAPGAGSVYRVTCSNLTAADEGAATPPFTTQGVGDIATSAALSPDAPDGDKVRRLRQELDKRRSLNTRAKVLGALIEALGLSDDLVGGAGFSTLGADIAASGAIVLALDRWLWTTEHLQGPTNGTNRTFFTMQDFHPFSMEVHVVTPTTTPTALDVSATPTVGTTAWYAAIDRPSVAGRVRRTIRLLTAPPEGSWVLARYVPGRALVRVGSEWLSAATSSVPPAAPQYNVAATGRAQLRSTAAAHLTGARVEDVWAGSALRLLWHNLFALSASGSQVNRIARALGVDRVSPRMLDRDLRRLILNTAISGQNTLGAVDVALRYAFPDVWQRALIQRDARWPGAVAVWYDEGAAGTAAYTPEPWETWLEEAVPSDGVDLATFRMYLHGLPILATSATSERFGFAGDHAAKFTAGRAFKVIGSTTNDGNYTVASVSFDAPSNTTSVIVNEDVVPPGPNLGYIDDSSYASGYVGAYLLANVSDDGSDTTLSPATRPSSVVSAPDARYAPYISGPAVTWLGGLPNPPPGASAWGLAGAGGPHTGMLVVPRELRRVLPAGTGLLLLEAPAGLQGVLGSDLGGLAV